MSPALAFVVDKVESTVFADRPAQSSAELVLPQNVEARLSEDRLGIERVVLEVFVDRAMHLVGAGLGDDIDDATQGPTVFSTETVVDHAKLTHRFLRRRGPLGTRGAIDIVAAIHGHAVAQVALPAERNTSRRGIGEGRLKTDASRGDAGTEQGEIGEQPATNGQRLNLLRRHHLADLSARGFDDRGLGFDLHYFAGRSYPQRDVDGCNLRYAQHHIFLYCLTEPL